MLVTTQQGWPGSNYDETRKHLFQEIFSDFMKASVMSRKSVRNKQGNGPKESQLLAIARRYFSTVQLPRRANKHQPHHRGNSDRTHKSNVKEGNSFYKRQRQEIKDRKQNHPHRDTEKHLKSSKQWLKQKKILEKESESGEESMAIKALNEENKNNSDAPAYDGEDSVDKRAVALLSNGKDEGREQEQPGYKRIKTAKDFGEFNEKLGLKLNSLQGELEACDELGQNVKR